MITPYTHPEPVTPVDTGAESDEQMALRIAREMPDGFLWFEGCGWESGVLESEAIEFARLLKVEWKREQLQLGKYQQLVNLIFESTVPYKENGECVFSDKVIDMYNDIIGGRNERTEGSDTQLGPSNGR